MNAVERHHRLTRIFIAVCNLDGDERRSALDRLCKGEVDVRTEVDLLLTFHDLAVGTPHGPRESWRPSIKRR